MYVLKLYLGYITNIIYIYIWIMHMFLYCSYLESRNVYFNSQFVIWLWKVGFKYNSSILINKYMLYILKLLSLLSLLWYIDVFLLFICILSWTFLMN